MQAVGPRMAQTPQDRRNEHLCFQDSSIHASSLGIPCGKLSPLSTEAEGTRDEMGLYPGLRQFQGKQRFGGAGDRLQ